jgi:hypothetical protein
MEKKKAIILILGVVIIILIAFFFFYFRTSINTSTPKNNNGEQTQTGFGNTSQDKTSTTSSNGFGNTETPASTTNTNITTKLRLKKVFQEPIAGAVIFGNIPNEKIRLVERGNGNIQEISFDSNQITRITNTTIPKIYEAFWDKVGINVLLRYIKEETDKIETYSAKVTLSTSASNESTGIISGSFFPENIKTITVNKGSSKVFYLLESSSGSVGYVSNIDGAQKKQVLTSPIKNWNANWAGNSVSLITKPSYNLQGFLFLLNTTDGSLEKILGKMYGLTALWKNNGEGVLYSQNIRNKPTLGYYEIQKDNNSSLSLSTFADKCVWSKISSNIVYCAVPKNILNGLYPDSWYNGTVSFSDDLWKINTEDKTTTLLYQTKDNENIDASDLIVSSKDDYIIFTNKKDLSLWSFKISPDVN